jgi:hypothetical protein
MMGHLVVERNEEWHREVVARERAEELHSMLTIWREITRFSMRKYISCSINCILLLVQLS